MLIGGLQKTSFLDYPDKISAIIFKVKLVIIITLLKIELPILYNKNA